MTNLSLLFLPTLSLDDRDRLPSKPGIYYALDRWGNVRYIGMSTNLYRRWNGEGQYRHHKLTALQNIGGVTLEYRLVAKHRLEYEEAIDIAKFSPDLNQQFPDPESFKSLRIAFDDVLGNVGVVAASAVMALTIGQAIGIPALSNLATAAKHHIEVNK